MTTFLNIRLYTTTIVCHYFLMISVHMYPVYRAAMRIEFVVMTCMKLEAWICYENRL